MSQDIIGVAQAINDLDKNIVLIYAFNGTGKTRLSVAFKDLTKTDNGGDHAGVYYNAYSEDLFFWNNDEENDGNDIRLMVQQSTLNKYHSLLDETNLQQKLALYKPNYDFRFESYEDVPQGIKCVRFFLKSEDEEKATETIKISRGEEQTFVWCFFLALFEVEGWADQQANHFFIDDPVSSLDDNNIFITAAALMDLIDEHYKNRKIIITTHHIGFFAILADWLSKGEKSSSYKNHIQLHILKRDDEGLRLASTHKDVFLYHLELLQTLKRAVEKKELYAYHFALLRQILENVSSFLGVGRISFVLKQIGISDADEVSRIVNTLSHKTVFRYEAKEMVPDNAQLFTEIFRNLMNKYNFVVH